MFICRSIVRGTLPVLLLAAAAPSWARPTVVMSRLSTLVEKEAIREQLAQYELLSDGDGETRDGRAWVDRLFTPDAVFEAYSPDGTLGTRWVGAAEIFRNSQAHSIDPKAPIAHRHYMLGTVFDVLTPTTAETRSTSIILGATKGADGKDPVGTMTMLLVYHDTWRKSGGVWRKSHSVLRRDT